MNIKCDEIVKQVVSEIQGKVQVSAKAAVLTETQNYEIRQFPIPELGKQDILIRVEGCPVVDSDMTEYLKEGRRTPAAVLGKEGTGIIVKMGSEGLKDITGKPFSNGDRVTSVLNYKGTSEFSYHSSLKKEGTPSGYGLISGAKGWFAEYIIVRGSAALFRVNDLDVECAMLMEPAMKMVRLVGRAIELKKLNAESRVVVQGCGMEGLLCIAALRSIGVKQIVAIDGLEERMEMAKSFGAKEVIDYHMHDGAAGVEARMKKYFGGTLADVAFQCVDDRLGRSTINRFVKDQGTICEMQAKRGTDEFARSPQLDLGGKDFIVLGFWNPTAPDYKNCLEFFHNVKQMSIPVYKLISHRYRLEQINEAHWAAIRGEGLRVAIVKR